LNSLQKIKPANTLVYPREIKPILDTLLSDSTNHNWLADFYKSHIQQKVEHIVNHKIFGPNSLFTQKYPNSSPLERLNLLKAYFLDKRFKGEDARPYLEPLKKVTRIRNIQSLLRVLQNDLVRAIAKQSDGVSLDTQLHAKGPVLLRHLIESQVLIVMQNKIAELQLSKVNNPQLTNLHTWIKKELAQLCPVQANLDLDARRFSLLEQDLSKHELSWHNAESLWYFLNGANRLSLFIQHETLSIKKVQQRFWKNVRTLNKSVKEGEVLSKMFFITPLKGLRFCWDLIKASLIPYRFLRTLVNELHYLSSKVIDSLLFRREGQYRPVPKSLMVHSLAAIAQLSLYVGLLMSFGLPILPNPTTWLPQMVSLFVPFSVLGYAITAFTCSILTYSRDTQPNSKPVRYHDLAHERLENAKPKTSQFSPKKALDNLKQAVKPYLPHSKLKASIASSPQKTNNQTQKKRHGQL